MFERSNLDDTGIVNEDVNATVVPPDRFDDSFRFRLLGYVAGKGQDLGAALLEITARTFQLLRVARADGQPGALLVQLSCQNQTKAARCAADKCDFAMQVEVSSLPPPYPPCHP